jgi:hypothetical protein
MQVTKTFGTTSLNEFGNIVLDREEPAGERIGRTDHVPKNGLFSANSIFY